MSRHTRFYVNTYQDGVRVSSTMFRRASMAQAAYDRLMADTYGMPGITYTLTTPFCGPQRLEHAA